MFCSVGRPIQFSCIKNFRYPVVPGGGFRKGEIIQGIMEPTGVLPNRQYLLIRKGVVTGESAHALRPRNSQYGQIERLANGISMIPDILNTLTSQYA